MPIHQGSKLKKAVDESKLKVFDISKLAEIPVSSLYDIFKKEDVPRKKLEKLCNVLGLNLDEMYFEPQELSDHDPKITNIEVQRLKAENDLLKKRIDDLEKIISLIGESKTANSSAI